VFEVSYFAACSRFMAMSGEAAPRDAASYRVLLCWQSAEKRTRSTFFVLTVLEELAVWDEGLKGAEA
jgi:hypothetical protein